MRQTNKTDNDTAAKKKAAKSIQGIAVWEERPHARILRAALYAVIGGTFACGLVMLIMQSFIIAPSVTPPPAYSPPAPVVTPVTPEVTPDDTPGVTPVPGVTPEVSPDVSPAPDVTPEPGVTPEERHLPVRVYFTKPQYASDIIPVPPYVAENGAVTIGTVDSAADSAWHDAGPAPGEPGNAILSGHESWRGKKGIYAYLKEIEFGEEVVVELDNGELIYYVVGEIQVFHRDEFPPEYLSTDGRERLTLITCKGDRVNNESLSRVVAVCFRRDTMNWAGE